MMDFAITSGAPDGIKVEVEFWVENWDDLTTLMKRVEQIEEV